MLNQRRRSFWRAVVLVSVVVFMSPLGSTPFGHLALIGLPTAVALVAFQRRTGASLMVALGLVAAACVGVRNPTEMWYIERGWGVLLAGGFTVTTALLPGRSIFERAVAAVLISIAVVATAAGIRPELFTHLDWHISGQFDRALATYDLERFGGAAMEEGVRQVTAVAKVVYPALLVLASIAALGCATYVTRRLAGEEAALPPLRDFRFNDHFAWMLILGLGLLVLPIGVWAVRTGTNVVSVMGGLYVLRGAAVLVWLGTSVISSGWSIAIWAFAALFFYPITIGAALVMGLSDTWLDLRSRLRVEEGE